MAGGIAGRFRSNISKKEERKGQLPVMQKSFSEVRNSPLKEELDLRHFYRSPIPILFRFYRTMR